jgi:hypothetical protein
MGDIDWEMGVSAAAFGCDNIMSLVVVITSGLEGGAYLASSEEPDARTVVTAASGRRSDERSILTQLWETREVACGSFGRSE